MNYKNIYDKLITFRKNNPVIGYSEVHHILPRSLGGSDDFQNLVSLTAREHFIAHLLLTKIYNEGTDHYKMVRAFMMMMLCSSSNQDRFSPSKRYDNLRKEFSKSHSIRQTGINNTQYGTVWVIHEIFGPKRIKGDKLIEYIDQGWFLGRTLKFCKQRYKMSDEHKRKISESAKNQLRVGKKGRKFPNRKKRAPVETKIVICPHCGKNGGIYGMSRWHFDNCKNKVLTQVGQVDPEGLISLTESGALPLPATNLTE